MATSNSPGYLIAPGSADTSDDVDLSKYFRLLRRRWSLIAAVAVSITLICAVAVSQVTPLFSASAHLAVQTEKTQVVDIQDVVSDMSPNGATMETQATILRSRGLASKLADKLDLARDPEFAGPTASSTSFSFFSPSTWLVDKDAGPHGRATLAQQAQQRALLVNNVISSIKVGVQPGSYILTITATSADPVKAALIANTLADLYINDQIEAKYDATRRASSWLEGRVAELRSQALASDRAVEMYRAQSGLVSGAGGAGIEAQQLSELNSQLILARSERAAKEAQLAQVRRLVGSGSGNLETSGAILDSALIQRLREQESEVLRKLAELQATYGERHPRIINATAELRDLRRKIADEVRKIGVSTANEVAVSRARENALASSLNAIQGRVGRSGQAEVRLRELQREADSTKVLYETFLTRYKETLEKVDIQRADARIVSLADAPVSPSFPKKGLTLTIALILALFFGVGLAFVVEMLDLSVRSGETVEELGGGAALSLIPSITKGREKPEDIVCDRPQSMVAESLRTLRGALTVSNFDNPPRVIMLTSSVPAEGKTFTSIGLARVAAQAGQNTIIVDADMRHPRVHEALGLSNDCGLSDYLSGARELTELVQRDPQTGLTVLTAGPSAPNPSDMLRSDRMAQMIRQLREQYDFVVIDTPPFLPMTDSQNVTRFVDKMLLVVRWGETPKAIFAATVKQANRIGAPLAGTVITQVNMERHAHYGYSDYGYHYSKYGAYYGATA